MDHLSQSRWPRGLKCKSAAAVLLGLRVFPHVAWILSLVNVVTCQKEIFAAGRLLVHRIPTDCVCLGVCVRVSLRVVTRKNNPLHIQCVWVEKVGLGRNISAYTSFCSLLFFMNQDGLKLNGIHQVLACADDVNILGGSIHTVKENAEDLVVATKEIGLEVNADKTKYMVMSRKQTAGLSYTMKVDNSSIERVEELKYL